MSVNIDKVATAISEFPQHEIFTLFLNTGDKKEKNTYREGNG
jgi:hypothetical protein